MKEKINNETEGHRKDRFNQITTAEMIEEITFQAYNTSKLDDELLKFAIKEIEDGNPAVLNSKLLSDFELMQSNLDLANKENEINPYVQNKERQFGMTTIESKQNDLLSNNYSVGQNFHFPLTENKISDLNQVFLKRNKRCTYEPCTNKNISLLNENLRENQESFLKSKKGTGNNLENASVLKESLQQNAMQTFYPAQTSNINRNISNDSTLNNAHDSIIGLEARNFCSEIPTFYSNPESINFRIGKNENEPTYQKPLNIIMFAKFNLINQLYSPNQEQNKDENMVDTRILINTKSKINSENLHKTAISSKICEEKDLNLVSKTNMHLVTLP